MQEIRNAMNPAGLVLIVTEHNIMDDKSNAAAPPGVPCYGISKREGSANWVRHQISDFLEGRTHGEDLFHALYDHVLDEPIPERMGALFKK
jgi:hypothetical protein